MTEALTDIAFAPLIPVWLLVGLAVAALALSGLALALRARAAWLRAALLAVLVLALANPALVQEEREPLDDVALLVVDESPSQDIGERREETEAALEAVRSRLDRLEGIDARVVRAGADALGGRRERGDGTRLFRAIDSGFADVPASRRAGVVMLTDGQVHDVPPPEALADAPPLHVLLSGRPGERDRRLRVAEAPAYAIVGDEISIRVSVDDLPAAAAETGYADVSIRRDGRSMPGQRVRIGRETEIRVPVEHAGRSIIELETGPGPEELTLRNNRAVVVVNGVRDRLRVLLVSGEPHAGERVWRNLLKSDPAVDLVHFTILRPPAKQDATPIRELSLIAFPIRELFEEKLNEFDLIVFDRYTRRGLIPASYMINIAHYVQAGGALLEAAGPSFADPYSSLFRTALGDVMPGAPTGSIHERSFRPRVTETGERHPVTAGIAGPVRNGEAQWGSWFRLVDADADRGRVLMTGADDRPLLLLDRVGEGRVGQLLSDHIWLWARGYDGGGPHGELLRRLAHWLMKEPDLEEYALEAEATDDRLSIERRSLDDQHPPVTVTAPDGSSQRVDLEDRGGGRAGAVLPIDEPGLYRVDDGERSVLAAAGALDHREFDDVRATPELLAPVASSVRWLSEGGVPDIRTVRPGRDASGRGWIGLHANRDYVVTGVLELPLLPPLLLLALIGGLLAFAWRREST